MTTLTHDEVVNRKARTRAGLLFAVLSAASFGLSGPLASGLLATGWSPGAVVLIRIVLGALVLTPMGLRGLRGRGAAVRRNLPVIALYGLFAVAAAQFCYYSAVQYMPVGPAILIEYASPAAVVVWMWLRHGHRPAPVTIAGALVAALGLVLVLDLLGGVAISITGALWACGAMVGAAVYFIVNADEDSGLPPLSLAWAGMLTGGAFLGLLGGIGVMPLEVAGRDVTLAGTEVPWWVPLLLLGVVSAAVAYGTGVAAGRRLGSRLSSFVGLLEVVSSVLFAWLLLGQLPATMQFVGGALILAGVIGVKLGEEPQLNADPGLGRRPHG